MTGCAGTHGSDFFLREVAMSDRMHVHASLKVTNHTLRTAQPIAARPVLFHFPALFGDSARNARNGCG